MLVLNCAGVVSKEPKHATSTKGLAYCKFQIEIPQGPGRWSKRVGVTVFGERSQALMAANLNVGDTVSVWGEPQARGYQDKTGKPMGVLEVIGHTVTILHERPRNGAGNAATAALGGFPAADAPTFTDDDIPF